MSLARRNLIQDKTRFVLSVIGVALAVMLILILSSFLNGLYRQISAYLDHTPGSIVVAQDGVGNLLGATSLLPAEMDSVVIVSHDQRIKDIADRVLWLEDGQFKQMTTMAIDPVCDMSVEQEKAISAEWNGQMYYFCAKGCREEFLAKPEQFSGEAG